MCVCVCVCVCEAKKEKSNNQNWMNFHESRRWTFDEIEKKYLQQYVMNLFFIETFFSPAVSSNIHRYLTWLFTNLKSWWRLL